MCVDIPIKIVRDIVAWCIETDEGRQFFYSKQFIQHLNRYAGQQNVDVEIPTQMIGTLYNYCEKMAIWDKLGRYGNFYYALKRITNSY